MTVLWRAAMGVGQPADLPWWLSGGSAGSGLGAAQGYASGAGVRIGVVEQGIDLLHGSLLAAQIETSAVGPNDLHGTQVAALIAGQLGANGGGAGAAFGATVVFTPLSLGAAFDPALVAHALRQQAGVDVANNSWGAARAFSDNFRVAAWADVGAAIVDVAATGRGGLGTSLVFAAGNGRMMIGGENRGDDANFHNLTNARQVIAVAASGQDGAAAPFSSPGANLLLAAPGHGVVSAGAGGGGQIVSGTSFAAPLVTGTIALMHEVNAGLGWRDVQDILAMTARVPAGGAANAGSGVNGGGLVFDRDMGFGLLDAEAAVRLARTWDTQATSANEVHVSEAHAGQIEADGQVAAFVFEVAESSFRLDWVTLTLTLTDARLSDLRIELIAPSGTVSLIAPNLAAMGTRSWLDFSFASAATRGEDIAGAWTVRLTHPEPSTRFSVYAARLDFYGDRDMADDTFVFTRSFAGLAGDDAARRMIVDRDGGRDTLNFSAAAAGLMVDLGQGRGVLDGVSLTLDGRFERVFGTVGADTITGNTSVGSRLFGAEGDDLLTGGGGRDWLNGGRGADVMAGGGGNDTYVFNHRGDRAVDAGAGGSDLIRSSTSVDLRQAGLGVEDVVLTGAQNLWVNGSDAGNRLWGNDGANVLRGFAGDDRLHGGAGADTLTGGAGADTFVFATAPTTGRPDTVTDFTTGVDRIMLDLPSAFGLQDVRFGTWQAHAPSLWHDKDTGRLLLDWDGLGNNPALTLLIVQIGATIVLDDLVLI